jgi:hypothetical protein
LFFYTRIQYINFIFRENATSTKISFRGRRGDREVDEGEAKICREGHNARSKKDVSKETGLGTIFPGQAYGSRDF